MAGESKYSFEGPIGPTKETLNKAFGKGFDDKDAFLFPEKFKVDGKDKFALVHRVGGPDNSEASGNIEVVFADKIDDFKSQSYWKKQIHNIKQITIMSKTPGTWENKLGGGPPPIKTKDGWLFIYHSSHGTGPDKEYDAGLALLDLKSPRKVLACSHMPIMKPETPYEISGPVPSVVFPQGTVQHGDKLSIYYGCGDKNVGIDKANISTLLNYVKQYPVNTNAKITIKVNNITNKLQSLFKKN